MKIYENDMLKGFQVLQCANMTSNVVSVLRARLTYPLYQRVLKKMVVLGLIPPDSRQLDGLCSLVDHFPNCK